MDSRRVSLPVGTLDVGYPMYGGSQRRGRLQMTGRMSPSHLSPPAFSPTTRRSLPSTPVPGSRRSLPGTPRTPSTPKSGTPQLSSPRALSPRLADVDEYFPISPSTSSSSETSPRRLTRKYHRPKYQYSLQNAGMEHDEIPEDGFAPIVERNKKRPDQLRSFEFKHGAVVDMGYQQRTTMKNISTTRGASRRATCPEIWLCPDTGRPTRRVLLRIYGSRNCGKKTLSQQIFHHASSTAPEEVVQLSDDSENFCARTINFLLEGEEVELEILQESTLESTPFLTTTTLYIVMYSIDNRDSFNNAAQILYRIHETKRERQPLVVLVANKIDLKRNTLVTAMEGRTLAKIYKCSFVDVSALLSMNLELLWCETLKQLNPYGEESWMDKLVDRGKSFAKSCEAIVHKMITS